MNVCFGKFSGDHGFALVVGNCESKENHRARHCPGSVNACLWTTLSTQYRAVSAGHWPTGSFGAGKDVMDKL